MADPSLTYQQLLASQHMWTYTLYRLEQVDQQYTLADVRRDVTNEWAYRANGQQLTSGQVTAYLNRVQLSRAAGQTFGRTQDYPTAADVFTQPFLTPSMPFKVRVLVRFIEQASGEERWEPADWSYSVRPSATALQADVFAFCKARARALSTNPTQASPSRPPVGGSVWRCNKVVYRSLEALQWAN
jgi:hypothetical protein